MERKYIILLAVLGALFIFFNWQNNKKTPIKIYKKYAYQPIELVFISNNYDSICKSKMKSLIITDPHKLDTIYNLLKKTRLAFVNSYHFMNYTIEIYLGKKREHGRFRFYYLHNGNYVFGINDSLYKNDELAKYLEQLMGVKCYSKKEDFK